MKAVVLLTSWAVTVVGLVVCTSPFVAAQVPGTPNEMPPRIETGMFTPEKDVTEAIRREIRRYGYTFEYGSFDLKVPEQERPKKAEKDGRIWGEAMFITEKPGEKKLFFQHHEMYFWGYISPLSGYPFPGYLYHIYHTDKNPPGRNVVAYILFGTNRNKDTNKYDIIYYDYEFNPMISPYVHHYHAWRAIEWRASE